MKYKVRITAQAEAEIEDAYIWIREDSPAHATAWRRGLLASVQKLKTFPQRCAAAPESTAFGQEIRQLLYGAYRILFVIQKNTVHVLHVRHGARQSLSPEKK
jgi:plasmid stabilization system protein ParE